jgi:Short C-terminal domain
MNDGAEDRENVTAILAEHTAVIAGQIRKLAELHADGILTDEEFAAKKGELLSRL